MCHQAIIAKLCILPMQELNLFCTLCTTLFALGCLVLSIINGAALVYCTWAWPCLQYACPLNHVLLMRIFPPWDLSSALSAVLVDLILSKTWAKPWIVELVHVSLIMGAP